MWNWIGQCCYCSLSSIVLILVLGCSKPQESPKPLPVSNPPLVQPTKPSPTIQALPPAIKKEIQEEILQDGIARYAELTVILAVKDAQKTGRTIEAAGGKVTYDPNFGDGSEIPFLIAELPPKKLFENEFIQSLELRGISVDHPRIRSYKPLQAPGNFSPIYVPTNEVGVVEFRKRPGNVLGENTLAAVIDTGIDAAHFAFQDRVVYWADLTREGTVDVEVGKVTGTQVTVKDGVLWTIPSGIDSKKPIYVGVFSEEEMGVQAAEADKLAGQGGFDLNGNGLYDDEYLFVAGEKTGASKEWVLYLDRNGDGALSDAEAKIGVGDFNSSAKKQLLSFSPSKKYPLLFDADPAGTLLTVTVGVDQQAHGTHVAGIIAADDKQGKVIGVAPRAKLMALKVCSGITCTDSALLRGLIEAFYNPQGLVPDVVNLSLGSLEHQVEDPLNILMRDLSAKFGAAFFTGASNDGPGYRTLNSLGSHGPATMVGAYASREMLQKLYNLDADVKMPFDSMLFFSSMGPSFTGQLRPNLVAPGAALSLSPMHNSEMMNGTSMASPLAAGTALALIGYSRTLDNKGRIKDPVFAKAEQKRKEKIELSKKKEKGAFSNLAAALAIRQSFERTAKPMPQYTITQRGFGLMQLNPAVDEYRRIVDLLNQKKLTLVDFAIETNGETGLYDRNLEIEPVKQITLSVVKDAEHLSGNYDIQNSPLELRLMKVEIQAPDGSIEVKEPGKTPTTEFPITLANRGVENAVAFKYLLTLNNYLRASFLSVRHLEKMERGKTYIAEYALFDRDQKLFTLVDQVHRPIELSSLPTTVDFPSLANEKRKKSTAFVVAEKEIEANGFHRYPIAITKADYALNIEMAFSITDALKKSGGFLYYILYDPSGKIIERKSISRSNKLVSEIRKSKLSTRRIKPGIYELVIANSSGRWMGKTQYDLLVWSSRVKPSESAIALKTGQSSKLLSISNPEESKKWKVESEEWRRLQLMKKIKLLPNHWSLRRLQIPSINNIPGPEKITVEISKANDQESLSFGGRIVNQLFTLKGKSLKAVYHASESLSKAGHNVVFEEVERPKEDEFDPVYVAVETYELGDRRSDNASITLDLEAWYKDLPVKLEGEFSYKLRQESTAGVLLLELFSPKAILGGGTIRKYFKVKQEESEVELEIPVTIESE